MLATTTTATSTTVTSTNQHMFLELRASAQSVGKCYNHLGSLIAAHDGAQVNLAGVSGTDDQFFLVLDIDLGPSDRIAEPSPEATTAFEFVSSVYEGMFEFLPQYSAAPDAEQRHAATAFLAAFDNQAPAAQAV